MEREGHPYLIELTGIHINFDDQAIEFEDRHGTVGRLRFTGTTVLYEGRPLLLRPPRDAGPTTEQPAAPLPDRPPRRRTQPPRASPNTSLPTSRSG